MRALPRETIIEDQHIVASTPPLAHQSGAGFHLRGYPEPSGLLQLQRDLAELALQLQTRPTRGDFLHPVGDGTHQQLTAEARRGLSFVEMAPQLAKFAEVEVEEARQRLRAPFVVSTRHNPSPLAGRFNGNKPVDRPVISILAARHRATGLAQPGNGGPHGMRQPTEPLPNLGNRSALGLLEHGDQLGALGASRWLIATTHAAHPHIGAPQNRF